MRRTLAARIRQLERSELSAASELLARAFAADPFIGYFFLSRRRRHLALPRFFRAVLHELVDSEALFATEADGRLVGVSAWVPPDPVEPTDRSKLLARLASIEVRLVFPRAAPRLQSGFDELGRHHPDIPHWYLAFVGIEPAEQRAGHGKRLVSPVLERADREHVACYLETPFNDTRAFYRRLGFEDSGELRPVAGAPTIWTMTRPARAA